MDNEDPKRLWNQGTKQKGLHPFKSKIGKIMNQKPDFSLIEKIMKLIGGNVRGVGKVKISKHIDRSSCRHTGTFQRQLQLKKKRRRKIAHQSRRINRMRAA